MGRRHVCGIVVGVALCALAPSTAAATALTAEYEVRYGPLTVLSLRARSDLGSERYRATADMETTGIVGTLFPWHASATSEGRLDEAGLHPLLHRSRGEYRGAQRTVAIDYQADGAVVATIHPLSADDDRDTVPLAQQRQTLDPLTATLSMMNRPCNGVVPVFDGRRRYDIRLVDLGEADVPEARRMLYSGRARRCQGAIEPMAGFWRSQTRQDEPPTQIDYWIASPQAGIAPMPVYLELSSSRGTLSVYLTALEPAPAP